MDTPFFVFVYNRKNVQKVIRFLKICHEVNLSKSWLTVEWYENNLLENQCAHKKYNSLKYSQFINNKKKSIKIVTKI